MTLNNKGMVYIESVLIYVLSVYFVKPKKGLKAYYGVSFLSCPQTIFIELISSLLTQEII
jgi:hypothetical protein